MGGTFKVFKWIVGSLLVIGFVIAGAGVFLFPQIQDAIKASQGKLGEEIRLQAVEPGRLVRTVSAPGEIEPVRNVKISARITAEIVALPFEEGDRVHAGDIVLKLNDRDLKAGLDASRANLGSVTARLSGAHASFVKATSDWERAQLLFKTDDVSQADLDSADAVLKRAESDLHAAEKNVEAAQADVAQTEENLKYAEIRSPINGRVTKLNAEVGELVVTGTMNNQGTVILEIADLSEMIVKTEVDESDVAPVRAGQTARIHINAYPGEVFEGRVKKVALQHSFAADRSKYYETEVLLIPKDDRTIFSGLTANVDIEVETIEDVILAPSQAVLDARIDELPLDIANSPFVNHEKTFARIVYRMIDGKAVATPVSIGSSDLRSTVILGGLEVGQEIVIGPWAKLQNLENGATIRVEKSEDEQQTDDSETTVASETEDEPAAKEPPTQPKSVASSAG